MTTISSLPDGTVPTTIGPALEPPPSIKTKPKSFEPTVNSVGYDTEIETTEQIPRPLHVHPALSGWRSDYLYYDPETFRPEIEKALARAKWILRNNQEDFEELLQDVHFQISKAQQYYGDRMNAALAYQIAKNQAGRFLQKRIKSQTIVDTDAEGNPVLDEFGLARGLNSAELTRQSVQRLARAAFLKFFTDTEPRAGTPEFAYPAD